MKKIIFMVFCLLLLLPIQSKANNVNHIITDKTQKCKIHYLSSTPKKMWYIKTDNDCPDGWVEGFANVQLFDLFDTEVMTISGFFKQGYWWEQFTPLENLVSYESLDEDTKTLSFLIDTDKPSNTQYLALFRSTKQKDRAYSAFSMCQKEAYFLVVHPYAEDFKNSAFQGRIFKQLRQEAQILCPKIQHLIIFGSTFSQMPSNNCVFRADMDLTSGQTNLRYRQPSPDIQSDKPSELRKEKSETIVAITSSPTTTIHADYGAKIPTTNPKTGIQKNKSPQPWDYTAYNYSAIDLALLAKITPQPIQGKAVMHIASVALDGTGFVDQPYPILLQRAIDLKPGWAIVHGTFSIQDEKVIVNPLTIYPCTQEWCHEK